MYVTLSLCPATDSPVHHERVLRFVVEMIAADCIMLGSDMPFSTGNGEPAKVVAAGLQADHPASINYALAANLFRIRS